MQIQSQCDLSQYSTFGIGGPARYFAQVKTLQELKEACEFAKRKSLAILPLGKGSNILFDDRGFDGLVLHIKLEEITFEGATVTAGGGASFTLLGAKASRQNLGGLEFASGIPGTVGGAVFMNAGANGKETKDSLHSVRYMTFDGKIHCYSRDELTFAYRTSPFQTMEGIIVEATFQLEPTAEARILQKKIVEYRIDTQPYKAKSAGCIFRNPEGNGAGLLIEQSGLKGYKIGGAEVSTKHANFIVNSGNATAKDIEELIKHIRETVQSNTGITLHDEVRRIPYSIKSD